MKIFKQYDIRWKNKEIREEIINKIGYCLKKHFGESKVFYVMHDTRPNSPKIAKEISKIIGEDKKVVFVGVGTTPMEHFLSEKLKKGFFIMVTASHLDYGYNGIKIEKGGEVVSYNKGLKKVERCVEQTKVELKKKKSRILQDSSLREKYLNYVEKKVKKIIGKKVKRKIIIDYGNATSTIYKKLLDNFGLKGINTRVLKKPRRKPNPSEDKKFYRDFAKRHKFSYLIAFDSDADRAVLFDNKGRQIEPEKVMVALIKLWKKLKKKFPSSIIMDETCSLNLENYCKKNKIKVYRSKVGRSNVIEKMKKVDAELGVEKSGHFYFKEFFGKDSGIIAAAYMIKAIEEGIVDEVLMEEFEYKYRVTIELPLKKFEERKILERFRGKVKKIRKVDGLTVFLEKSWFNIRKSNTSDIIRVNIESKEREEFKEIKAKLKEMLR